MPLLPLRVLPTNDSHDGPLALRVEHRPTGSAYVYVRRETDKKTWICKVRTLQSILAPSQQARELELHAVVTCLYHGVAYDASGCANAPLELRRREVGFSQPETWTDGDYRLTMRVAVRSSSIAVAVPAADQGDASVAIPVVDIAEESIVFGFNFTPSAQNLDHEDSATLTVEKRAASIQSVGVAFPNARLNWTPYDDRQFIHARLDGVSILNDGFRVNRVEVTVDILHAKAAALFVLSANSQAIEPAHTTSYQQTPGGDLLHTIAQFDIRIPAKAWIQVTMLMGSAPALQGSTLTIREKLLND